MVHHSSNDDMKTAEQIKAQATLRGFSYWPITNCSICMEPVGYAFFGETVAWDGGCDCARMGLQHRTWQDVANTYNQCGNDPVTADLWQF